MKWILQALTGALGRAWLWLDLAPAVSRAPPLAQLGLAMSNLRLAAGREKQRVAAKKLMRSESRFVLLSNMTQEGVMIQRSGVVLAVNGRLAIMRGHEWPEDLSLRPARGFLAPEAWRTLPDSPRFETTMRRRDGVKNDVESLGKALGLNEPPARALTVRDLTAQAKQEAAQSETIDRLVRAQNAQFELIKPDPANLESAGQRITELSTQTLNAPRVGIWGFDSQYSAMECPDLCGSVARRRARRCRELPAALASIKNPSGLAPIGSGCKPIRDGKGFWNQLETFAEHATAKFSRGLCPDCARRYFPNIERAALSRPKGPESGPTQAL